MIRRLPSVCQGALTRRRLLDQSPSIGLSANGGSAATRASPSIWRSCCSIAAAMSGCSLEIFLRVLAALANSVLLVGIPGPTLCTRPRSLARSGGRLRARCLRHTSCRTPPGGTAATLFFTTFTRTRLPVVSSPSLIWPMRRTSRRTGHKTSGHAAGGGFGIAHEHADLLPQLIDEDHGGP